MIITKYVGPYSWGYHIRLNSKSPEVIVSRYVDVSGNWKPTTINWPGCGDMTHSQTNEFIQTLAKAMEIAAVIQTGKVFDETI